MTLHWWMHWFWITCFATLMCHCDPIPANAKTTLEDDLKTNETNLTMPENISLRLNSRTGKAIAHSPKTSLPPVYPTPIPHQKVSIVFPLPTSSDLGDDVSSLQHEISHHIDLQKFETVDLVPPTVMPITHQNTTSDQNVITVKPTINQTDEENKNHTSVLTEVENKNLTVDKTIKTLDNNTENINASKPKIKPLNESVIIASNKTNVSESDLSVIDIKNDSVNIITDVEEQGVSTVRALSLETAVGRRAADNIDGLITEHASSETEQGLDAGAVAGICFGTLVLLSLSGAISFVLYRRRYLNKPQTLNDKCSNPDSSGYIDDSTIRENSEEMFSLDNDSFLNSLEAMTIPNYWTDSVKHTKL